jgi:hypothetical protein
VRSSAQRCSRGEGLIWQGQGHGHGPGQGQGQGLSLLVKIIILMSPMYISESIIIANETNGYILQLEHLITWSMPIIGRIDCSSDDFEPRLDLPRGLDFRTENDAYASCELVEHFGADSVSKTSLRTPFLHRPSVAKLGT